jgi:hypothetical protein
VGPAGAGPAERQARQVICRGAVEESGGRAQLLGDPVHRRDVDLGTGNGGSTIESHA